MLKNLKLDIFFSFILGISGLFFLYHHFQAYPIYQWGFDGVSEFSQNLKMILPTVLFLFLFFSGTLFFKREKLTFLNGLLVFVLGLSLGMVCFALTVNESNIFGNTSLFSSFFRAFSVTMFFTLASMFFTFFLFSVGRSVLDRLKIDKPSGVQQALISFFFGFGVMSFLGFFLAKLNLFSWSFILFFGVLLSVFCWKKWVYSFRFLLGLRKKLKTIDIVFLTLFLTLVVLNVMQSFYPFSVGWDSANQYLLTVKILMEEGVLRTGIYPSFIEIVLAIFGKFMGLSGVQFLLSFWGSFLPIVLFLFLKNLKVSTRMGYGVVLALFCLPAIQFQLSRDLKLDLIFVQLILIAIWCLKDRYLKLSALLFGFSVLCKLTAVWFFPVLCLIFLWENFPFNSKKKIRELGLSFLFLVLPLLVLGAVNVWDVGNFPTNLDSVKTTILQGKSNQPILKFLPQEKIETTDSPLVSTSYREEVERYAGFKTNFFDRLWAIFLSSEIPEKNKQYVNLGFLWLSVGGLGFVLWLSFWKKISRNETYLWLLTFVFGAFWIFMGEGVAWYSFPFLVMSFLLFTVLLCRFSLTRTQKVFSVLLFFSCVLGLSSRFMHTYKTNLLTGISWAMFPTAPNQDRLEDLFYQEEKSVAEMINQTTDSKILRVGTMTRFFIKNMDRRLIDDSQMDQFQRLNIVGDWQRTMAQLRYNDIEFLLIDRGATTIETDPNGTLHQKFQQLETFIEEAREHKALQVLFYGKRIVLVRLEDVED